MIMGAIAALTGSRWVLYAAALFAAACSYEGWKYHQRSIGASKLEAKIERKADADVAKVQEARTAVDADAGRVRNKYERAD